MKKIISIFPFIITFLLYPYVGQWLFSKTLYPKFGFQERNYIDYKNLYKGQTSSRYLTFRYNERGLPGYFKRTQQKRCAIIGGSTFFSKLNKQEELFISQIQKLNPNIYFESYVYPALEDLPSLLVLKDLVKQGRHFDCILIGIKVTEMKRSITSSETYHHWSIWSEYQNSPFQNSLAKIKTEIVSLLTLPRKKQQSKRHPKEVQIQLRMESPEIFKDTYPEMSPSLRKYISKRYEDIFEQTKKLSQNVFYINQSIAYAEDQHPGVPMRWTCSCEVEFENGEKIHLSNKAYAQRIRERNIIGAQSAKKYGVEVINLDGYMKNLLPLSDDLFEDRWHFTPVGAREAALFVSEKIKERENEF